MTTHKPHEGGMAAPATEKRHAHGSGRQPEGQRASGSLLRNPMTPHGQLRSRPPAGSHRALSQGPRRGGEQVSLPPARAPTSFIPAQWRGRPLRGWHQVTSIHAHLAAHGCGQRAQGFPGGGAGGRGWPSTHSPCSRSYLMMSKPVLFIPGTWLGRIPRPPFTERWAVQLGSSPWGLHRKRATLSPSPQKLPPSTLPQASLLQPP